MLGNLMALLDRLTHHAHILEFNGESYRLKQSKARRRREGRPADPETGKTNQHLHVAEIAWSI